MLYCNRTRELDDQLISYVRNLGMRHPEIILQPLFTQADSQRGNSETKLSVALKMDTMRRLLPTALDPIIVSASPEMQGDGFGMDRLRRSILRNCGIDVMSN